VTTLGPIRFPTAVWLGSRLPWAAAVVLCSLHGWAVWIGMGGWNGLMSPWPLSKHDHPLYFHSAWVTRHFLRQSGTTAGYDPYFMAGYAKSILWPTSSTLPEVVLFVAGGNRPVLAFKLYVLVSAALVPWLVAGAGVCWRLRPDALVWGVALFLVYIWTDWPINYAAFGMVPFFLAVPLGLLATASATRYLDGGGAGWWLAAALGLSVALLVHPTTVMLLAPAVGLAYGVAVLSARRLGHRLGWRRHFSVGTWPVVVLAANAFWWWPGVWLAGTRGPSDVAFFHPESVWGRLARIGWSEAPIEAVLWALGPLGLVALAAKDRIGAAGLAGLGAAGFGWGYLAGWSRALDALQPGRHTYALYTAAAVLAGVGLAELQERLRAPAPRLGRWLPWAVLVVGSRIFGPSLVASVQARIAGPEPFLSSQPSPRLRWLVDCVQRFTRPGQRVLYEEGGKSPMGERDPLQGDRLSGLLPFLTGVEVIGGPYLHVSLNTNFTQFGEGKLFEDDHWSRDQFVRYARLYRPSFMVCWSLRARRFCRANPDLITILDDAREMLFARVRGFDGATILGHAAVAAQPGSLEVREGSPELDGPIVLRYHSVPYLRSRPARRLEPRLLEGDPVPFIGLPPEPGPVTLELDLPP
jgi:hypothetical protein